jgi:hypothetical protein
LLVIDPATNTRRIPNPKYVYRLAWLYGGKGMKQEAIEAYGRFLELRKSADKDLPEYVYAKGNLVMLKYRN